MITSSPANAKVSDLLAILAPRGEVTAWTKLANLDGKWFDYSLRLHKTELIAELRKMDRDTPVMPFYIEEWTSRPKGWAHDHKFRVVRIGHAHSERVLA